MASNTTTNTIRMPFLPTVPLPVNAISTGMLYMYSCSQCDFKTHIEGMFKQHVDSVHLGITTVANNIVLSNAVATLASSGLGGQGQTLVMTSPVTSIGGTTLTAIAQPAQPLQQQQHQQPTQTQIKSEFKCPKCDHMAVSKNQLTLHKRKMHGKQVSVVSLPSAPAPQFQQTVVQAVSPVQPAPQPQPTPQQQQQQPSQQIVTVTLPSVNSTPGKKTYSCQSCGYSTTRRDGLAQHYDSVHLKIKNHQCDLCPYAASQKGTLNRHVKLRHKKKDIGGSGSDHDPITG